MLDRTHELKVNKLTVDRNALENTVRISKKLLINKKVFVKLTHANHANTYFYPVTFDEHCEDNAIQLSHHQREEIGCNINDNIQIKFYTLENEQIQTVKSIRLEVGILKPRYNGDKSILLEDLEKLVRNHLSQYPLIPGQSLLLPYKNGDYDGSIEVLVKRINDIDESSSFNKPRPFMLKADSIIQLSPVFWSNVKIITSALPKAFTLNFKDKGVGGLDEQIDIIIRDVFLPRALPPEYAKAYGEKFNSNGILLYGPPGTGKTLIASVIGHFFTKDKVKIVKGPELKNKFVGQSTENLRDLFTDAEKEWQEKGADSSLHVIIFDEIDALFPRRGSSASGAVDDEMVGQMLTILDGIDSMRNVIIIGTTNRKDLIDPALLRPKRFGVVLEIGLPDEEARNEIFSIHTREIIKSGILDTSVDLHEWAKKTKNFTGAEIEELLNKANHFAMGKNFDISSDKSTLILKNFIKNKDQLSKITQQHLLQAFAEIKPMFGVDEHLQKFNRDHFIVFNQQLENCISNFNASVAMLQKSRNTNKFQILLTGESGTGKTDLAMYLAQQSGADYMKLITPETFHPCPRTSN